jgi:hypothetical protein
VCVRLGIYIYICNLCVILQPRDDDPVESKSPRLSPQDQSISASLAFSTLGGHSSVVDDGYGRTHTHG